MSGCSPLASAAAAPWRVGGTEGVDYVIADRHGPGSVEMMARGNRSLGWQDDPEWRGGGARNPLVPHADVRLFHRPRPLLEMEVG